MYLQMTTEEVLKGRQMYLRTLTNKELLRYAEPVTDLEKELILRLQEDSSEVDDRADELAHEVGMLSWKLKAAEQDCEYVEREMQEMSHRNAILRKKLKDIALIAE